MLPVGGLGVPGRRVGSTLRVKDKIPVILDLEGTGTKHQEDYILELGMIVCNHGYDAEPGYFFQEVVNPGKDGHDDWLDRMNDYVVNMHTVNDLIRDVVIYGKSLSYVEEWACNTLAGFGRKHDFIMAGSGVSHFDRRFIETQMPELNSWFVYPHLDSGVVRRFFEVAGREDLIPSDGSDKPHRALDDCRIHLEEARAYLEVLRKCNGV